MSSKIPFTSRESAGKELATLLREYQHTDAIVVGLPRGGVVTAKAVARELHLPLEIVVVKKIGHPYNPEYALGAITEKGFAAFNEVELQTVPSSWVNEEKEKKLSEAVQKRDILWGDRPIRSLRDQVVIVIDDGIATGYTLLASLKHIHAEKPKQIIVAVPVAPRDSLEKVRETVDDVRVVHIPDTFLGAVGNYYEHFVEVTDAQAKALLQNTRDPLVFCMPGMENVMEQMLSKGEVFNKGSYQCMKYVNQELRIQLENDVHGKDVVFVGCITPPHERIMETFLFCHTCKKEGAGNILLILPYMAYTRHDHDKPKEDQALSLVADIASSAGVTGILTVDVHGHMVSELFTLPVISLDPWMLLAQILQKESIVPDCIVAPDEGAERRALMLKTALRSSAEVVVFHKERSINEVKSVVKSGMIRGQTAVLVDDILDTGRTLKLAVSELQKQGIQRCFVVVSHAVCSSSDWEQLFSHGVELLVTTDSVMRSPALKHSKCKIVSVAGLLAEQAVHLA